MMYSNQYNRNKIILHILGGILFVASISFITFLMAEIDFSSIGHTSTIDKRILLNSFD